MITIHKVKTAGDIKTTAKLAFKIWNQHFVPIIGQEQVDYMLEKFQSERAMKDQVDNGYEYYLLSDEGKEVAYMALVPDYNGKKMMISKIYVDKTSRGKGHGLALLKFAGKECTSRGFNKIWLTVNRFNFDSVEWYKKRGFKVANETQTDIGNGFFMDDYIMELIPGGFSKN